MKSIGWLIRVMSLIVGPWLTSGSEPDFTIVVLPDTQFYSASYPHIFQAQTDWIVSNRTSFNIVYVAHVGDITNDGGDQWLNATNALYRLENPAATGLPDGIPYGVVPGNHDHYGDGISLYNTYFGVNHFASHSYYGGHCGSDNNSHYDLFSAGGLDFIVAYLDYEDGKISDPPLDAWSDAVLKSNSNRRAILVSHDILLADGNRDERGQVIYDNLKGNTNLFLMLCGHNHGESWRQDTYQDHTVTSCLSDYQEEGTNGGNGYLRLYQFSPSNNLVHVRTYSPYLDQYNTDANSQFEFSYQMSDGADVGQPTITTASPLAGGIVGEPYSTTLQAADGVLPYSWAVVSNSLPSGLGLVANSGAITGMPTMAMTANFTVRVTGADSLSSEKVFSLTINSIDLPTGLVAYYPFNGNANDVSGNEKNGVNNGATATVDRFGNTNSALYFNGSAYISLTNRPLTGVHNACSVSAWFSANTTGIGYIFRHRALPEINILWSYSTPGQLWWQIWDADDVNHKLLVNSLPTGQWIHCVGTYDGSVQAFYVNGVLITNSNWTGTINWDQQQDCGRDGIGGDPCFRDGLLDGSIDEVRIYDRALSASEVQAMYSANSTNTSPYMTWKASSFTAAELADATISGDVADPDGDSVPNLLEYALALDPKVADANGLPAGAVQNGYLSLTYRQNKQATDLNYLVEACGDLSLGNWSTNGVVETSRIEGDTYWSITAQDSVPIANATSRFMRLKVANP